MRETPPCQGGLGGLVASPRKNRELPLGLPVAIGIVASFALLNCVAVRASDDLDALQLQLAQPEEAGAGADPVKSPSRPRIKLESSLQGFTWRKEALAPGSSAQPSQWQIAADIKHEWALTESWRATLSDRFEAGHVAGQEWRGRDARNYLREAFITWRTDWRAVTAEGSKDGDASVDSTQSVFIDAGRINQRIGVGSGYNPTDWFRAGSGVSGTSRNPATMRENRLGVAALRGQLLTSGNAATLMLVPRLSGSDVEHGEQTFSTGFERTNRRAAVMARWVPTLSERYSLDIPVIAREGASPEAGINATALLSDAMVGTFELSAGRRRKLQSVQQALAQQQADSAQSLRLAVGGTWTASSGVSMTLERHYAGDALSRKDWADWRSSMAEASARGGAARAAYGTLASNLGERQDLLARDMWFARVAWDDAFDKKGLSLSAFTRINAYDKSVGWQGEVAWNDLRDWSLSFVVGGNGGPGHSEFGGRAQKRYAALSLTVYR